VIAYSKLLDSPWLLDARQHSHDFKYREKSKPERCSARSRKTHHQGTVMITVISEVETKALNMGELEELSSTAARELTNRIKAATDDLYEMLWRAHQGKAWAALGYTSWKNYCETEFRMSARHSYRLLDFVEVRNVIREGDPRVTPSSEKQVRPLAQLDREEQPAAWTCAVEIADGKQPTGKQVAAGGGRAYFQSGRQG
jgi:hypothetical protein